MKEESEEERLTERGRGAQLSLRGQRTVLIVCHQKASLLKLLIRPLISLVSTHVIWSATGSGDRNVNKLLADHRHVASMSETLL